MSDFGTPPHERQAQAHATTEERRSKAHAPVAQQPKPANTERPLIAIVDEDRDVAVQVLYTTVVFRPHQQLRDKRMLEIAKTHGVRLRYKHV